MDNPPYAPTVVKGGKGNHAPILSAGCITIAMVHVFENACRHFFQNKKIPKDERVVAIIYNFESSSVQSWVNTHHDRLLLTFSAFLLEFKKKFLPENWQDDLVATQISVQSSQSFLAWMEAVHEANSELGIAGSDYHIAEEKLRSHFVPHLSTTLKASYDANNTHGTLDAIVDLEAWIQRVHLLDIENMNKREDGTTTNTLTPTTSSSSNAVLSNTTNTTQPFMAKLTQAEHNLLRAHKGCFHCRFFYAGHFAPDCPLGSKGRPTPEACKNVTLAEALKAKAAFEGMGATMVVAVFGTESDDDSFEMSEDEASEYVNQPFSLPSHLWWDCCIDALLTCTPTPIQALIDHSFPPVLISSELVDVMGLTCRKLFKPFPVADAFVNGQRSADSSLTEYCRLHLQSRDAVWKSKVVNAIISPMLHTDLMLGLDFLMKNKIVVDAELRTAIAKDAQYDLLHPALVKRKIVHDELLCLFVENPEHFDLDAHMTTLPCVIAAIRKWIEELVGQAVLDKLDSTYKARFMDRFPMDIPHANDLPINVYHHIEVTPGAPISVGRAYSCPRKYREGWKTLIEEHSKAGWICPLSSPYASPSFIIPKADVSVLP
ncbi:hypothetical protein L208DRAFT_1304167, partial [Tricholoma matsutake]